MINEEEIWVLLNSVPDPEIPVLSIIDLGVVRGIKLIDNRAEVTITPTYSGCPAMNRFEADIVELLAKNNIEASIKTVYDPAWTTDWLTEEAKGRLRAYGIAPPEEKTTDKSFLKGGIPKQVTCPQCKSTNSRMISQFGSTACKALYQCNDCQEPFDYFKCI